MTRLEQIAIKSLKEKAAKMLNCKVSNILKVNEGGFNESTQVECRNGNSLLIPFKYWVGEIN